MDLRREQPEQLRVLFAFGLTEAFYRADAAHVNACVAAFDRAFDGLGERFGVTVLASMDDDQLQVGPSASWPWTAYVIADAPDLDAAIAVCNLVRETPVLGDRLWKYVKVEARVGRPLFFART